jgi:hypothetical protein
VGSQFVRRENQAVTADAKPKLVAEYPWTRSRANNWWTADQLSYFGRCAWNHSEEDDVKATRIVVTESPAGIQDARACCDECYESVLRYVGESAG